MQPQCGLSAFMLAAKGLFSTFFLTLFISQVSKATVNCGQVQNRLSWKYCFSPGVGKNRDKLIVHFHGGGLSEQSWFKADGYSEEIRKNWQVNSVQPPNIVSISFGPLWLAAHQSMLPKSGIFEALKQEVFPYIETKLIRNKIVDRILIGESMGGFNAATYGLQNSNQFSRLVLLCPALGFDSFYSQNRLSDYVNISKAQMPQAQFLFKIRSEFFRSNIEEGWQAPIQIIQKFDFRKNHPAIFISCGSEDQFGFFFAARIFANEASLNHFPVTWVPVPNGKHCSVDTKVLSQFLTIPFR